MHTDSEHTIKQPKHIFCDIALCAQQHIKYHSVRPAARKYTQINIRIQNICNTGLGMHLSVRQHPVWHGVSVAGATRGHWWDLASPLTSSCRIAWKSDLFLQMKLRAKVFCISCTDMLTVCVKSQIIWIVLFIIISLFFYILDVQKQVVAASAVLAEPSLV